ncbi:MAG: hypothetical protein FWB91_11975, partial [Defluviitaleaceae bacterium]|nr:hypothetical protein [Defluviitaleaceae bacterium]
VQVLLYSKPCGSTIPRTSHSPRRPIESNLLKPVSKPLTTALGPLLCTHSISIPIKKYNVKMY